MLAEIRTPRGENRYSYLPFVLATFGAIQTALYYTMQSLYAAFLASFIISVAAVLGWTQVLVMEVGSTEEKCIRKKLWIGLLVAFLGIAAPFWVFEMNFCGFLLPYFLNSGLGGATLHIVWHIGAGTSSYLGTVLLTVIRLQKPKTGSGLQVGLSLRRFAVSSD